MHIAQQLGEDVVNNNYLKQNHSVICTVYIHAMCNTCTTMLELQLLIFPVTTTSSTIFP